MNRKILSVVSLFLLALTAFSDKPEFEPFGFVKGDMYYTLKGKAQSYGTQALTCVSTASENGGEGVSFTAQHTRFGLKGSAEFKGIPFGGLVSLDFFTVASNANVNPRMRQAYTWFKPLKGLDIRIGQQWDIFSPLNPTTNNTNANLWFNGNYGFRRAMIQVLYTIELEKMFHKIQISGGEGAKEVEGLGTDNLSGMPMLQTRLSSNLLNKIEIGVSGLYAAFYRDWEIEAAGFSVDLSAPLHKYFSLKGEYAFGQNLHNANIFTLGGNKTLEDTSEVMTSGYWYNATSKLTDFLHLTFGMGQEFITSDVEEGEIDMNSTIYGMLNIPIGKYFALAGEVQYIKTDRKDTEASEAAIVDVSGKISF